MALSQRRRDALPDSDFAVPGKRALPIPDETHTRLAWDMVDRTEGLTDAEKAEARRRIRERAKTFGIDTGAWEAVHARIACFATFAAMAIALPEVKDHPNRMPFSGILTYVDEPSDFAPEGAGGRRVCLTRAAADAALPSLLAMPIDFTPGFDGHDIKRKIGTITAATIVDIGPRVAIRIEGFFFKADFPEECALIKAQQEKLGFSFELGPTLRSIDETIYEIVRATFTGAAVLYKDKAAYQTTSLAARVAAETEVTMTKEELEALLATSLGPLNKTLETLTADVAAMKAAGAADPLQANKDMINKIKPHATALRSCAAAMEAAGIGLHSTSGHVTVLHHMAAHLEAAAARGETPYIYRDHDWTFRGSADPNARPSAENPALKAVETQLATAIEGLGKLTTIVTDLKAAAFQHSSEPARRTLPAEITQLIAKGALTEDQAKGGVTEAELGAIFDKAGTSRQDRIAVKLAAAQAGILRAAA